MLFFANGIASYRADVPANTGVPWHHDMCFENELHDKAHVDVRVLHGRLRLLILATRTILIAHEG